MISKLITPKIETKPNNTIKYFLCINSITTINLIKLRDTINTYSIKYDSKYRINFISFIEDMKQNNIDFSNNSTRKCFTKVYQVLYVNDNMELKDVCTIKNGIVEINK